MPVSAPKLVVLTPYYGGIVSAPVFSALGSFGIRHFQIPANAAPTSP